MKEVRVVGLFLLAWVLVLTWASSNADSVTLDWEAPTGSETCTSDATVPDPINYRLYQQVAEVPGDVTTFTFPSMTPGTYNYIATTVVADENGDPIESRGSAVASKVVEAMTVVDDKAYTVVKSDGKFVAFIIGTVPVGTVCDPNNMVKGEFNFQPFTGYTVPIADVTITGDVEPSAVVATCH